ncbi:AMP-binding protein [Dinoroseobacter sp. PD6]|uniref:AMP-binding protein n=1 Tax=Dinoroseobacter sp. PD6 TaxID=3028384 RepID=UPI00237A66B3|nr:AMP-binding protein [Dinoroseobacter sp. PD6]MDD9718297.1 AMP-binding protein [Dinoroseobacter sp. PD6]
MNFALWLQRTAARCPDAPALYTGTRLETDYAGFADQAARIGAALSARGLGKGDRIGVFMKNSTDYLRVLYGIWWCGSAAIPINSKLHPREAAWILSDAEAALCLVTPDLAEGLAEAAPDCACVVTGSAAFGEMLAAPPMAAPVARASGDLAWLFYTSGTTGKPKGVMMSFATLTAMTLSYFVDVDEVTAQDAILYSAPMSHGAGVYNFMHVLRGARHVVPESGGFDPAEIFDLAREMRQVSLFAAPTMVRRMIDVAKARGDTGDGIKTIVYAGGPMYLADIIEAVEVLGDRFVQVYGQGEYPMSITALSRADVSDRSHPDWQARLASVGVAQTISEVAILDAEGRPVPPGETGEIAVRGAGLMLGYWNRPEATAETIRDGWLWTGDMGRMDADGYVTMVDRSKHMIISGGSNVYPREVEEVLLTHPQVAEVSVVGRPHAEWGEEVVAFVVPAPGAEMDPGVLDAHCLSQIARFKRPKAYIALPELPKNNYGKVLKTELRARLRKG